MQKNVGILTFHGSHNFGSMLQAFSLQKIVENMNWPCEIINFRPPVQREMYPNYIHKSTNPFKSTLKYAVNLPFRHALKIKYYLFEHFITHDLVTSSSEYATLEDLHREQFNYHSVICGSDQIWNLGCNDFNWAYFLPFVNCPRIAFAPSTGPAHQRNLSESELSMLRDYLSQFSHLSCREYETQKFINNICGQSPPIVLDPTLLFDKSFWESKIDSTPIVPGKYIFVYTPRYSDEIYNISSSLSKYFNMTVVAAVIHRTDVMIFHPFIKKKIAIGPWEFLNLCKYAQLVCGKSFHLTCFSTLLQIPFFSINSLNDSRINRLFSLTKFQGRSITHDDLPLKAKKAFDIEFSDATRSIEHERQISLEFLRTALNT